MNATHKEYVLPDALVISSRVDLDGNFVDYNAGFRDVSGYRDDELKGKPAALLRHADMPNALYEDLWATIRDGRPWFGIVKNKRKNGDYYWLATNVSPMVDNGLITGYFAVYYPATRHQIAYSESLYANIRSGKLTFPCTKVNTGKPFLFTVAGLALFAPVLSLYHAIADADMVALVVGGVSIAAIGYGVYHLLSMLRPNAKQLIGIEAMAKGHFRHNIEGNDPWTCSLNLLRIRVAGAAAYQYDAMREISVLTTVMNATSTNLMIADNDFNIIAVNDSLTKMFNQHEKAFKKAVPNFDASRIVGSNMNEFHHNPEHKRSMLSAIVNHWTGKMTVAGIPLQLVIVPIINDHQKVGYVIEWQDLTHQKRLESQLALWWS